MNWPIDFTDRIILGDCREVLGRFPDDSIQAIVTSPPYWGLRDYSLDYTLWGGIGNCSHDWVRMNGPRKGGKNWHENPPNVSANRHIQGSVVREGTTTYLCGKCKGWIGTLGLEPTPELYVEHIVEVFREVKRVLRDDGTVWLNIGDSYASQGGPEPVQSKNPNRDGGSNTVGAGRSRQVAPCLKPKDLVMIPFRVALALQNDGWWVRSDIIWAKNNPMPESVTDRPTTAHEHVFLLAKSRKYYYDKVAVMEDSQAQPQWLEHNQKYPRYIDEGGNRKALNRTGRPSWVENGYRGNSMRNKRTVWTIPTQPYPEAHFATFPEKLVEPCILAGSSPEDIVLDPFAGSGTTCAVAKRLGRHWIGIEANADYVKLAEKRVSEAVHEPLLPIFE